MKKELDTKTVRQVLRGKSVPLRGSVQDRIIDRLVEATQLSSGIADLKRASTSAKAKGTTKRYQAALRKLRAEMLAELEKLTVPEKLTLFLEFHRNPILKELVAKSLKCT